MAMKLIRRTSSFYLFLAAQPLKAFAPPAARGLIRFPFGVATLTTKFVGIAPQQQQQQHSYHNTAGRLSMAKAGVSSAEELKEFVVKAADRLVVIDVRNPDAALEPGDQKSLAVAALPSATYRPQAVSLIWDRTTDSMPLPDLEDKSTPIITHCGGGGRGQLAKEFLEKHGYTHVLNGAGPKEKELWAEFGFK
jgi:rhodanese-related sulfurtransferase